MRSIALGILLLGTLAFAESATIEERVTELETKVQKLEQLFPSPPANAYVVKGAYLYTTSTDCAQITQSNQFFKETFAVKILREIPCGDTTYVFMQTFSPGYNPPVSYDLVKKSSLIILGTAK